MIVVHAPGKLFIAGEYAVVEPGEPSLLIAVDRGITVTLTPSDDAGHVHSSEYGGTPLVWTRDPEHLGIVVDRPSTDYVFSAINLIDRLLAERGIAPRYFDLRIESELNDGSGRKYGLGSSAAVTVAVIAALTEFYGLERGPVERFKLALLATIAVSPRASGGDLAASTYGGWVAYSAPDRALLAEEVAREGLAATLANDAAWRGLAIRPVAPSAPVDLWVGWTGSPASTARLVAGVRRPEAGAQPYPEFLDESRRCVTALEQGLTEPNGADVVLAAIGEARGVLQRLGRASGLAIETETLAALCDSAALANGAGKPSGAGGGDCGIAFTPRGTDASAMLTAWEAAGIQPLSLGVAPATTADATDGTTARRGVHREGEAHD